MIERTGWLLDLYEDPLGGLTLWFLDDDGARRRLRQRFPVTFYAYGPERRLRALEAWLGNQPVTVQPDQRQDVFIGKEVPVLSVTVARTGDLTGVFRRASQAFPDLSFADADLQVSLRYAAAAGVHILGRCRVVLDEADFVQDITPLDDPWALDPV
ncbi:MAG: hypothetical protein EHM21_18600, partial [Chloroflexi bacterium]